MTEETLFAAALEKGTPAERASFLDGACAGDPALRRRVAALLGSHEQDEFLGTPAVKRVGERPDLPTSSAEGGSATLDTSAPAERPGTVIGPYKLLQPIGEGGMGTVFMAEQTHPVRRKVAVKVIKAGMDSRQVIARFEAERQALAMMDHVNIARVLDAGAAESGRPYFVMELVHGVPMTSYCDDNRLTPRERLELFVPVCRAIQHAHQKGIIHRDIKPSNVMITLYDGRPVPKVIDFGVAKAIEQRLTESTLFTQYGTMVGTLEYMSPEQAEMSALGADTRSDIYSLGVLLYELLTGSTPLTHTRVREAAYGEVLRLIKEEEPPKPSTRLSDSGESLASISAHRHTEPAKLANLVRGELDWIVMKCLEKDRNRRYETASAFVADVQRYLADEPVQACPPSMWYRFRKLARRNKAGVLAATSLALGLLLAVVGLARAVVVQVASNAEIKQEQEQTKGALDREKQTNDDLATSLGREERTSYFRSIALADRELAANNVGRAEELLDDCPIRLRGWEWHHLKRRPYGPFTFRGHSSWVLGVAFSPDGKHVASASSVLAHTLGEIKVWDRTNGREVYRLLGHAGPVDGVAFSPDGKSLASAGWDRTVRVWDIATGKGIHTLRGHTEYVNRVAFSPDGKFLASASGDRTAIVWDGATFQKLRTLHGHTGGIYGLAFGPGGRLASASSDGTVRVWDAEDGRELHVLRGHAGLVLGVAFGRDGRHLASGGFDGTVRVWDAAAGKHLFTFHGDTGPIMSLAFSPDGRNLATGGFEQLVHVWDLETRQEALALRGHDDLVAALAFSPDGQQIASASMDGTVKVWDAGSSGPRAGPELLTLRNHTGAVIGVAFHPDSDRLASTSSDETVRLWNATTGEELAILRGHTGPVGGVAFSRDGRTLATAAYDGVIKVWDVATGKERRSFLGSAGAVALSPDGRWVAAAREGAMLCIWDTATGKEAIEPFRGHAAPVMSLAFSPDGRRLVTTGMDGTVKVWDATTGRAVLALTGHRSAVQSAAFSADGRRLATASWDKTARIWDAATGKELFTLRGHENRVLNVAFSPDGKCLATASWDNTVRIWDAATGKPITTLRGHIGYVFSVAFSPDGKRLVSSSGYRDKGEMKIWDATRWDEKAGR